MYMDVALLCEENLEVLTKVSALFIECSLLGSQTHSL